MKNTQALYQTAYDLHRNAQLAQAEACYRELLAREPRHAEALHLLGLLCYQTGRNVEAADWIAKALAIQPANTDFMNNHGLALHAAGRPQEALACYQRAVRLAPHDLDLQMNMANTLQSMQRFEEAAGCYRRLLRAMPGDPDIRDALCHALDQLGNAAHADGRFMQAEACYQEALYYRPRHAAFHYNLGNAQRELGKPAEACKSYQEALALDPHDADAHNNLGNVLRELGQLQEAIRCYETAVRLNPKLHHARMHLIHQQQHACDWRNLQQQTAAMRALVQEEPQAQISPFAFLALPGTTAAEQKRCAQHWLGNRYRQVMAQAKISPFDHQPHAGSKLRIGYLSADFRLHPLAFLITELMELQDRSQFELYAYSYSIDDKTPERKRLERAFDHFIDIRSMSQREAATRIHSDRIDILVDLTGFTQSSRTDIVALRPAPLLVNWLGFPGTMGALDGKPLFDYLLSDAFITPTSEAEHYAEQLMLLPDCYQPNDRQRPAGPAGPAGHAGRRADHGLDENAFVFCSFNQSFKITPHVFAVWMRLLKAVPDSQLWLLECNTLAKCNLLAEAQAAGVAGERIVFAPRVPIAQHLARHTLADLFLDTLPYNAHTTASDALWMALPLLTCSGHTFASRVAGSLLSAAGLPELITYSLEAYEARALQLAQDQAALTAIRHKLMQHVRTSPLFDTARFAYNLGQCYRRMWQTHCDQA